MRCKIGDLVIIINAHPDKAKYIGKITTIIRKSKYANNNWELELTNEHGDTLFAPDNYLMPIRDNPGEDETLSWAPVPNKNKELEKV